MFSCIRCVCEPGWSGDMCDVNINDCDPNRCANNGECIDGVNDFTCVCEQGFTGQRCQHKIDYCDADPCQNGGTCKNTETSAVCECRPGKIHSFVCLFIHLFIHFN